MCAFLKSAPNGFKGYEGDLSPNYWFIHQLEQSSDGKSTIVKFGCYKDSATALRDKLEDGSRLRDYMLPYAHINVEMTLPGRYLTPAQCYTLAKAQEGSWFTDAIDD